MLYDPRRQNIGGLELLMGPLRPHEVGAYAKGVEILYSILL